MGDLDGDEEHTSHSSLNHCLEVCTKSFKITSIIVYYHLTSTAAIAAALIPGHIAMSWRLILLSWNTGDSLDLVFGPGLEVQSTNMGLPASI